MDLNLVLHGMAKNFYSNLQSHVSNIGSQQGSIKTENLELSEEDFRRIREGQNTYIPVPHLGVDFKPYMDTTFYTDPKFHKSYSTAPTNHQSPPNSTGSLTSASDEATLPHKKSKSKHPKAQKVLAQPLSAEDETEFPHCKRKPLPLNQCPICKRFFRRMATHLQKHSEFQRHLHDVLPPGSEALMCRFCSKSFSNAGNLQIHLRIHTGQKPYVCDICQKGFTQSCNLTNHMRTHTGERPFQCPYCERAFSQSGNLTNHIRLHLDHKPFKCHFCDRAFTQSGNLSSHLKNNHKAENIDNL